ncbi:MAG: DMT family transporter [Anaerolineae bacterium]
MSVVNKSMSVRGYVAIVVTLLLWASAFAGIRAALRGYGPGQLALLRFLVASAALAGYGAATRMRLPARRDLPGIALMGLLGITVYQLALNFGEVSVNAGSASFLVAAAPGITAILAVIFLHERLTVFGWLGIGTAFAGVALIAFGEGEGLSLSPGALLVLLAAVATSLYFIIQKRLLGRYSALAITTYGIWLGTIPMLVFLPGLLQQVRQAPVPATLAVVYLGIFPAATAYVTWAYALSLAPAARAATFLFLSPLLATAIAWLWLGEQLALLALVGGALVVVGVVLVNTWGRPRTE